MFTPSSLLHDSTWLNGKLRKQLLGSYWSMTYKGEDTIMVLWLDCGVHSQGATKGIAT